MRAPVGHEFARRAQAADFLALLFLESLEPFDSDFFESLFGSLLEVSLFGSLLEESLFEPLDASPLSSELPPGLELE